MKHIKTRFMLIAAMLIMIISFVVPAEADTPVKVDVKVGIDGFYKIGYSTPVFIQVENNKKDIKGEIQLKIVNERDTITLYAIDVDLPKGTTKNFVMNVPIMRLISKLDLNIVEGEEVVLQKSFRINNGANVYTSVIGILSDDYDSVSYINKLTLSSVNNYTTKTLKLDEKNFPDNADVMKLFNVIVIDNYDTSKLSKEQYNALKKWIEDGGLLVLGTGSAAGKTLSVFKDDFLQGHTGNVKSINTNALGSFSGLGNGTAPVQLETMDMDIKDSTPIAKEGNTVLVHKIEKSRGVIAVTSFSLGLEPVYKLSYRGVFAESLLRQAIPSYYNNAYIDKEMMMNQNIYVIDSSLRNIPEIEVPKAKRLAAIFIIYILAVGPINYFILKRMDKREWLWLTVPVLSLVFAGVIYGAGLSTRLTEPLVNVISISNIDNSGVIRPKIYAGVFNPKKGDTLIEAGEGIKLKPFAVNNYYDPRINDNAEKKVEAKIKLSPKVSLQFYRSGVWSMRTVEVETNQIFQGRLVTNLNYLKGSLKGTIKNETGFDINEGYIVTPNQYLYIGSIKNGETKNIDQKVKNYFGNRYDFLNQIYKDPYAGPNPKTRFTDAEIKQFREYQQKRQILEYYFSGQGMSITGCKFFAWTDAKIAGDIFVNGKEVKRFDKGFISSDIDLNFRTGNTVEYPMGYVKQTIVNNLTMGGYDEYGKAFYGTGSFEIHFEIDKNITPEEMWLKYTANGRELKHFIWNNEKKEWEEGNYANYYLGAERIRKYVNKNNVLKLKFEMADGNVQMPQASVKGSVR